MPGRFGKGLDRGRGVHGAKWVFVTPEREFIHYKQLRETLGAGYDAHRKQHGDWILFKSTKEAKRYVGLLTGVDAGLIRNLDRQVRFDLIVANPEGLRVKIGVYIADFVFEEARPGPPLDDWPCHFLPESAHCDRQFEATFKTHTCGARLDHEGRIREWTWHRVVEDVKGYKEDLYLWKRKHFEVQYGRAITEF